MKTKLLLTTAMVASTFISNVMAEDLSITGNQVINSNSSYDKITINNGRLVVEQNSNVSVNGDITVIRPTSMGDGWEEQILIDQATLSAANITATGNLELEQSGGLRVSNATLIADSVNIKDADITTMGGQGNEGNDFILAGKSYNADTNYSKTYILANTVTMNNSERMGIGDDRINFYIEDGVELNLKGKAGMVANSIAYSQEGEGVIIEGYGQLNIRGGTTNLFDDALMVALNDVTISGGEVNLSGNSQIVSLAFDPNNESDGTGEYGDMGIVLGELGNFKMTGGTLNVKGDNTITGKDYVTITNGELNVEEGATLHNRSGDGETFKNTGFLLTNDGVMNVAGTLDSPLIVTKNGVLNFTSDNALLKNSVIVGESSLGGKGTLNVGLNKPTLQGYGEESGSFVIFHSGSTLGVKVNNESEHGVLRANTYFENGSSVTISTDKSMSVGDKWTGLTLVDGLINADNTNLSNGRFKVTLNGNNGESNRTFDVEYTQTASDIVTEAGGSASEKGTADAWDGLDVFNNQTMANIKNLLDELSQYNAKGYLEALKNLAPSQTPVVQQTSTETVNQAYNAVGSQLSSGTSANPQGASAGDALEGASVWIQGLANHAKLDKTADSDGFESDTYGTAFGFEKKLNDQVKLGVAYAYSDTEVETTGRNTDVTTHTSLIYGEYKPSNWYVNGIISYGWSDYEENKNVSSNIVKAKYDTETFGLQAMTGYDFFTKYANIIPEAGLRYIHIKTDEYTDTALQTVSGSESDIVTGIIGLRSGKTFETQNGMRIAPEVRFAMTYDLKHDDVTSNVTLPDGSSYSVNGKSLDRFGIEAGGKLTAEINDNIELSLGYEGKFRENYQDHSGLINFKYNF